MGRLKRSNGYLSGQREAPTPHPTAPVYEEALREERTVS